jgi:hypothetical protein
MGENVHVRERINEDRRLVILRLLVDYRGALNSSSLESAVRAWGHKYIDRAMITDDLHWLQARGCVKLDVLGAHIVEVCLSPKGERAATGEEWITGIARPSED